MSNQRKSVAESGFSLIELLVIVAAIAIIGSAVAVYVAQRSKLAKEKSRAAIAVAGANDALEALSNLRVDAIPPGGSFVELSDNTIQIKGECSLQTCDWLVVPGGDVRLNTSPAKGVPFDSAPQPADGQEVLLRRWRVDAAAADDDLKLRRITVVVLPDLDSTQPLAVEQTVPPVKN